MPEKRMHMVVGLGNPTEAYEKTRHNIGFMLVDRMADRMGVQWKKSRFDALYALGEFKGTKVLLVKPMAYMNRSGPPVQGLAAYYRILCGEMLIVHDDIDLALGRLKIKEKGGDGGHKGLRSLIEALHEDGFSRLRVGIGRPGAGREVTDHVLGKFGQDEKQLLEKILESAEDAVEAILEKGVLEGMNRFNSRSGII